MTFPCTLSSRLRLSNWLLLGCLAAGPAFAATPPTTSPLPAWDELSAEQREQLTAPIRERWNAEPAQRQRMLERAGRWQQMTPEERTRAHRGMKRWEHMSPEQRTQARALYGRMRTLAPAERAAFRAKWKAMTPEQKQAWLQANPAPADSGADLRRPRH